MKKLYAVIGAIVFFTAISAFSKIIVNPDFDNGPVTLSITAIELTDSATRVNTDIYSKPGWWIRPQSNTILKGRITGNSYKLMNIEGLNIDEKYFLGDSAYVSSVYVFEPVNPIDSIIDFIEPDGWEVTGVKLHETVRKPFKTHIHGTLEGNPASSWFILSEALADHRVNKSLIIPVHNGKFAYDLYTDSPLVYKLCIGSEYLDGSWRNISFSSADSDVSIQIPKDFNENAVISGGAATNAIKEYENKRRAYLKLNLKETPIGRLYEDMEKTGKGLTPEAYNLKKLKEEGNLTKSQKDSLSKEVSRLYSEDKIYSEEGKRVKKEYYELSDKVNSQFFHEELSKPSPAHLYQMLQLVTFGYPYPEKIFDIFIENYRDTLTEHPYHKTLSLMYEAGDPAPGKKYTDFSAPDLEGNIVKISDRIGGKVAIIDLWASWCGSCRRHSKEFIPFYEKYHDKGFEIIGVAREKSSTEAMVKAIKRDGYPWLNLVELDDVNSIWKKYHTGNGGGKIVMVDKDGTILAVNPSAEEVEKILIEKFGKVE